MEWKHEVCGSAMPKLCKQKESFDRIASLSIPGLQCGSHDTPGPRTSIGASISSTSSMSSLSRGQ